MRADTVKLYALMERYVKDLLKTFGQDERVLLWDLWNEPGNGDYYEATLPMLKKVYGWAREANPSQPLTVGIWNFDDRFLELNAFQLENSDVISYHNYNNVADHEQQVKYLKLLNRPLFCTEYMARRRGSTFQSIMPMLKKNKVVAINWGFVSGKTNTIFAWDDPQPDVKEPPLWFHDILRQDGTPFSQEEVDTIRSLTGKLQYLLFLHHKEAADSCKRVCRFVVWVARNAYSSLTSKSSLPTPQRGQTQSAGMSSNAVPGSMPLSGSPTAGS